MSRKKREIKFAVLSVYPDTGNSWVPYIYLRQNKDLSLEVKSKGLPSDSIPVQVWFNFDILLS